MTGALLGLGALVTGCDSGDGGGGGGGSATSGCGEEVRERIDPDALVHILPGAAEPDFLTDPPTSGPHAPAAPQEGVLSEPLSRSDQVGQLEAGVVLIQHGELVAGDREAIEALAGGLVVVAPNDDLPAPIVATAWLQKLECESLAGSALEDLRAFADAHAGNGPGSDAGD